jgi:predicted cobalt transporter CbtA
VSIFVAIFLGLIGMALILYGRKEGRWPHIIVGLVLVVYPYFVGNFVIQILIAVVLLAGLSLVSRLGY